MSNTTNTATWNLYRNEADGTLTALGQCWNVWPLVDAAFAYAKANGIATKGSTTVSRNDLHSGYEIAAADGSIAFSFIYVA